MSDAAPPDSPGDPAVWLEAAGPALAAWLRCAPGFFTRAWSGVWFVGTGGADQDNNCLVAFDRAEIGRAGLEAGIAELRERRLPGTIAVAADFATDYHDFVTRHALTPGEPLRHEWIELAALTPGSSEPIEVDEVREIAGFQVFIGVLGRTFRFSPAFIAETFTPGLLDDPMLTIRVARVAGAVAGFVVTWRRGENVYVVIMGVDPAFRRRGIGRGLLCSALIAERRAGGRYAHLVSSEVGAHLYRAVGFRRLADHPTWLLPGKDRQPSSRAAAMEG